MNQPAMNQTMRKFGYPASLVREYAHWAVLVRPAQPTLGCLVLASTSAELAFGDLPAAAHAELKQVTGDIEAALARFVGYEKLNYLMLMMVDPHVHFHVIPRYAGVREWDGVAFPDHGWPKLPDLGQAREPDSAQRERLLGELRGIWR